MCNTKTPQFSPQFMCSVWMLHKTAAYFCCGHRLVFIIETQGLLCEVKIDYNADLFILRGSILCLVLVPHLRLALLSCLSPSYIASKVCKILPCNPIQIDWHLQLTIKFLKYLSDIRHLNQMKEYRMTFDTHIINYAVKSAYYETWIHGRNTKVLLYSGRHVAPV